MSVAKVLDPKGTRPIEKKNKNQATLLFRLTLRGDSSDNDADFWDGKEKNRCHGNHGLSPTYSSEIRCDPGE
jgi:hypothetical protein